MSDKIEKTNSVKIYIGILYLIILAIILYLFFSNFSLQEIKSYQFLQSNREYLINLKEANILLVSLIMIIFTIIWVLLLGFGTPIALISGFIFGKWLGTVLATLGLAIGATSLYLLGNFFLSELIKEKFLTKYKSLEIKFKKNEFTFFLIYRFIGGIPFAIANLIPILFKVKLRNYFFGTLIGMTPQLFIMVCIGSGFENIINSNKEMPSIFQLIKSKDIYLPIFGFFILFILSFLFKKKFKT